MRTATILIQHTNPRPGCAPDLAQALTGIRGVHTATPTIGAYDVIVTTTGPNPQALAATTARIQRHADVGRTLTLAHVDPLEEPEHG